MAADGQGNDLAQVGVPIGGLIAFAPYDTVGGVLSDADLGATPVTLPSGYEMLGLVKQDGAPQHAREAGDAIEFWQKGYTMPGDGTRTLQVSLAESNDAVLKLVEGKEPNSAGVIYVDSGLPAARILVFLATKFKGGREERYNGVAQVTAVEVDQDERGAVRGRSVTLTWQVDPLFNGAPFQCRIGNDGRIESVDFGGRDFGGSWGGAAVPRVSPESARRQLPDRSPAMNAV